jgi:ligand-binding SRPBCC domain-containing protein
MMYPNKMPRSRTLARPEPSLHQFSRSVLLKCSIDEAYRFHLDPHNAAKIMPPGFFLSRVVTPDSLKVGDTVEITVRIFGIIPQHWVVQWEELDAPTGEPGKRRALLLDRTKRGPFPVFNHEHRLSEEAGGTRLEDHITFAPPFPSIGWLLLPAIYVQLHLIFWWRHLRTRAVLG